MSLKKIRTVLKLLLFAALALTILPFARTAQAQGLPSGIRPATPREPRGAKRVAASIQAQEVSPAAQGAVSFVAHRDFVAADVADRFAQADLNGDGVTDLVVANANLNSTNISVLLGNSDGTFQSDILISTGGFGPFAVALADFNGDGKVDAAVTNLSGVAVLLGDGQGGFGAPTTFRAGSGTAEIVAADLNGDRKLDLAVANGGSNNVSILLGDGHGSFSPGATLAVGRAPVGIAVGDLNHDGRQDLVVADSGLSSQGTHSNTVAILLGTGAGGFSPASFITVTAGPLGVALADFNKDSRPDVAVTNSSTGQVSLLLGKGDGTFQPPATFIVTPGSVSEAGTGFGPSQVKADDFNGDGNKDLAIANSLTATAAVLLGDGKGGFSRPLNLQVGKTPVAILTGDYNHDGKRDFITSNSDADTVSVVLGNGNGSFHDVAPAVRTNAGPSQIVAADFNNDGILDVATSNGGNSQDGDTVSVLLGQPGGRFGNQKVAIVGSDPLGLAAGDFNNDGRVDLVVANFGVLSSNNGSFSLLVGNGDGTFQPAVNFTAGDFPDAIAAADFNGDGNPDVVVGNFGTSAGTPSVSLSLGDGKGGFAKAVTIASFGRFNEVLSATAGDFSGDGKADVAYVTGSGGLQLQLGNGDGTFQAAKTVANSLVVFGYAAGDLNRDGVPDFAVEEGGVIQVLLGDGRGNFTSAGQFSDGEPSGFSFIPALVLADFNGDGFLDVAAPDGFSDNVSILLGNGDGTLGSSTLFTGAATKWAVAGNFNGDLLPDLALAAVAPTASPTSPGEVLLLQNNSNSGSSAFPIGSN